MCIQDTRHQAKKENPSDSILKIPGCAVHFIPTSPNGHHGLVMVMAVHSRYYSIPVDPPCASANFECLSVLVEQLMSHCRYTTSTISGVICLSVTSWCLVTPTMKLGVTEQMLRVKTDAEGKLLEAVSATNTRHPE